MGKAVFGPWYLCSSNIKPQTKIYRTMLDKIAKSNKIMALVSIATLVIVAWVLVYKPWKASQKNA